MRGSFSVFVWRIHYYLNFYQKLNKGLSKVRLEVQRLIPPPTPVVYPRVKTREFRLNSSS